VKKPPTDEHITHDPDEAPTEPVLRECERLAASKVDWSDYPERTHARERVHEILDVIEDALASNDEERLDHIARFANPIQGFGGKGEGDQIRWELSRVERAVRHLPASKRPKVTALKLIFDLELSDPRYGTLDPLWVLEQLRSCKASPGGGRGNKSVPATLAALMLEAGAHDVTTFKDARRKIENARTPSKRGKSRARPSEFRRLRQE